MVLNLTVIRVSADIDRFRLSVTQVVHAALSILHALKVLLLAVLLLEESLVVILAVQVRVCVRVHETEGDVLLVRIATVVHVRVLGARGALFYLL